MLICTKYEGSRPCVLGQEVVLCFLLTNLCKNVTPGGNIWNQGHGLTKLGRGLPADVTYQYQRARPCGYRQGDIFMCSQYNPI